MPRVYSLDRLWRTGVIVLLLTALSQATFSATAAALKLSGGEPTPSTVVNFQISPNGRQVVYKIDVMGVAELWSVPIAGGAGTRLSVAPEPPNQVGTYLISPDSQWVIYSLKAQSGQGASTPLELFRVPITGPYSDSVKLNTGLVGGGNVLSFQVSQDSQQAVYLADQETDEVYELYRVALTTPAGATKLNKPLVLNGDVTGLYALSPDSTRVVYVADQEVDGRDELYSVPITGPAGSGVKLNGALASGGDVGGGTAPFLASFTDIGGITPDSTRVVYAADQTTDGVIDLYSVPLDGSAAPTLLSVPGATGVFYSYLRFSPDSGWVVYGGASAMGLYLVPAAGPANAGFALSTQSVSGFYVSFTDDSSQVVYYDGKLRSVPVTGPANAAALLFDGAVLSVRHVGGQIAFRTPGSQLWGASAADMTGSALLLDDAATTDIYRVSPTGERVVYLDSVGSGQYALKSVPAAGPSSDAVTISPVMTAGPNIRLQLAANGREAVYQGDAETAGRIELFVTDEGAPKLMFLPLVRR